MEPETQDDSIDGAAAKLKGIFQDAAPEKPIPQGEPEQAEPEISGEESEEDAETQAEVETIGADQLAELLKYKTDGIVVNDDGEIRFRTKIDGEEGDATLTDLIERYQRDAHLTNRSKELANLKKQQEDKLSEVLQMSQKMAQQNSILFDAMKKEVLSKYDDTDWKTLRMEDPSEYAARQAEMNSTLSRLDAAKDASMQAIAEQYQAAQEATREKFQQYLAEQRDAVKALIPNWGPEAQKDIKTFLNAQGFVDQEVNNIFDARMVNIAYQAMLYQKGKAKAGEKLEKKPLPKVMKPGVRPDSKVLATESERKAKSKLRKSGSVDDAAAVFKQMFKQ